MVNIRINYKNEMNIYQYPITSKTIKYRNCLKLLTCLPLLPFTNLIMQQQKIFKILVK